MKPGSSGEMKWRREPYEWGDHGSGAGFTQDMRESVLVTLTAIALFIADSGLLPKRDEPMCGSARSNNSPQERPSPLWELLVGGDA